MTQTESARAESLNEQDPPREADSDKKPKSRRPASEQLRPIWSSHERFVRELTQI